MERGWKEVWLTKWHLTGRPSVLPFEMLATIPAAAFDVVDTFDSDVETTWGPVRVSIMRSGGRSRSSGVWYHVALTDGPGDHVIDAFKRLADARRWIRAVPKRAVVWFEREHER